MKKITTHKVPGLNEAITITADDEVGCGGAHHQYTLSYLVEGQACTTFIDFQEGPIDAAGPNGVSNEALLAVVIDRLEGFQKGPFACVENEAALSHVQEALEYLKSRTLERMERGVEGSLEK